MNERDGKRIWFAAKAYGYGWGEATCWQGWAVYTAYMLLAPFAAVVALRWSVWAMVAVLVLLTVAVFAICHVKGEALRWRWGGKPVEATPTTSRTDSPRRVNSCRNMQVFHLFLGPLLLILALWFRTHLPMEINPTYGYRTTQAMRGPEIWAEAQLFSANLLIAAALLTLFGQLVLIALLRPSVARVVSTLILMVAILLPIPITESHLKKHFDEQGRRTDESVSADRGENTAQVPPPGRAQP